jgi:FAD/FMN-containing dehydrogenase
VVTYAGDQSTGESVLRPLRDFGDPILDGVRPQPYTALQQTFDAGVPKGQRWYSKAHYLDGLSDAAIDTVVDHVDPLPGPFSMVYFEPMGGAIERVDTSATAFPHRDAAYGFHILTGWAEPEKDDAIMAWTRDLHAAMAPHASGGVYVNLLGEDEPERTSAAYGSNAERLARIKAEWDPENVFRMNHNIEPAT